MKLRVLMERTVPVSYTHLGKSADAQQGNQQPDSAVKDQHKEDCRRLPRQMEFA